MAHVPLLQLFTAHGITKTFHNLVEPDYVKHAHNACCLHNLVMKSRVPCCHALWHLICILCWLSGGDYDVRGTNQF
jgi:hypothetical protein